LKEIEMDCWEKKNLNTKDLIQSIARKIGCDYTDEHLTDKEVLQAIDEAMDFTMTGMDISIELQKMLDKFEDKITNGMSENEKKAYNLGVKNSVDFLDQLLKIDPFVLIIVLKLLKKMILELLLV
jgi:hypothetical protein